MRKKRAPRNRTITLSQKDRDIYSQRLITIDDNCKIDGIIGKIINQDIFDAIDKIPENSVDLVFVDPPYNMNKKFGSKKFQKKSLDEYEKWLDSWLCKLPAILKDTGSLYICGDWQSSPAIFRICNIYFHIRNRITWEREKGRGAKSNWKNCSEDIWFCTMSDEYTFNVDDVKLKRQVIAPYKDKNGKPKDWQNSQKGKFRITHPSNLWTDISVPFWSMPENTDHPTQKPEKLLAKIILASSNKGDIVFDPFLGSGSTSVVAKKLNRKFFGIEIDKKYCLLTEKRLDMANDDRSIQGYTGGYFWERNTLAAQKRKSKKNIE
ncbi:MAG: DNA-methyltransferase [Candidatus Zixiibacteriota bacterium]